MADAERDLMVEVSLLSPTTWMVPEYELPKSGARAAQPDIVKDNVVMEPRGGRLT